MAICCCTYTLYELNMTKELVNKRFEIFPYFQKYCFIPT